MVHNLEHAMFFWTAVLFWWPVIHPTGGRRRLGQGLLAPYLMAGMMEGALIGLVLAFVNRPLYQTYRHTMALWGMSPLVDQQLAGALLIGCNGILSAILFGVLIWLLMTYEAHTEAGQPALQAGDGE
jgi:cytochrome c oxidase assembly factor CtaG